jgi:hypothetical protein
MLGFIFSARWLLERILFEVSLRMRYKVRIFHHFIPLSTLAIWAIVIFFALGVMSLISKAIKIAIFFAAVAFLGVVYFVVYNNYHVYHFLHYVRY